MSDARAWRVGVRGTDRVRRIGGGELHVWRAMLVRSSDALARYWPALSEEERARAQGLRLAEHRRQFVVSHGVLRSLLALYSGRVAQCLELSRLEHGKPFLRESRGLEFSMAHSRDLAVYALARDRRVGVDIEWMERAVNMAKIAGVFFSTAEQRALEALPLERRAEAFYACWTRKEAYVKARGDGLSLDLRSFTVSLDRGRAVLLGSQGAVGNERWMLGVIEPGGRYRGAFAVDRPVDRVRLFEWQHEHHP